MSDPITVTLTISADAAALFARNQGYQPKIRAPRIPNSHTPPAMIDNPESLEAFVKRRHQEWSASRVSKQARMERRAAARKDAEAAAQAVTKEITVA